MPVDLGPIPAPLAPDALHALFTHLLELRDVADWVALAPEGTLPDAVRQALIAPTMPATARANFAGRGDLTEPERRQLVADRALSVTQRLMNNRTVPGAAVADLLRRIATDGVAKATARERAELVIPRAADFDFHTIFPALMECWAAVPGLRATIERALRSRIEKAEPALWALVPADVVLDVLATGSAPWRAAAAAGVAHLPAPAPDAVPMPAPTSVPGDAPELSVSGRGHSPAAAAAAARGTRHGRAQ